MAYAWCGEVRGFGVRCLPSGHKSFFIQYRNERKRCRWLTLGSHGRITVEQARDLAKQHFGKIAAGIDPADRRQQLNAELSVADLCDLYLVEAFAGRILYRGKAKKLATVQIDKGRINRHIKPLLGHLAIREVTRHHVYSLLHAVSIGKTAADERTKAHGRARV